MNLDALKNKATTTQTPADTAANLLSKADHTEGKIERGYNDLEAKGQTEINQAKNVVANLQSKKKKIIDLGKRLEKAFGFISSNVSDDLKKKGFQPKADVFISDTRMSFEQFILTTESVTDSSITVDSVSLKFAYNDFISPSSDVFAPPAMITFNKKKRIDETILGKVDSTVIEHYGHEPWDVKIQGILIDMVNHQYPSSKVQQLRKMFEIDWPFKVEGKMFEDMGIKSIYFADIEMEPVQGFPDTWSFTLTARSIKVIEAAFKK